MQSWKKKHQKSEIASVCVFKIYYSPVYTVSMREGIRWAKLSEEDLTELKNNNYKLKEISWEKLTRKSETNSLSSSQ